MNYEKKTPIKVTVEGGFCPDKKIELTMSAEANLSDWIEVFKTVLTHQTFTEETIQELFSDNEYTEGDIDIDCKSSQFAWKNEF
jgi:hypothetical protein